MRGDMNRLLDDAESFLDILDPERAKRIPAMPPFVIEVLGIPNAGKTTLTHGLRRFFARMPDWRVYAPPEGPEIQPPWRRREQGLYYSLATSLYSLAQLLEANFTREMHLLFLDRGPFDGALWSRFWAQEGAVTKQEAKRFERFFLAPSWLRLVNLVIVLMSTSEEALRRDRMRTLTDFGGVMTNRERVQRLSDLYVQLFSDYQGKPGVPPMILIDTTSLKEKETAKLVLEKIFALVPPQLQNPASSS